MSHFRDAALATLLSLTTIGTAAAGGIVSLGDRSPVAEQTPIVVAYDDQLCQNWHRECSRLWRYGSRNWNACMSQPAAIWDCGGGRGERGGHRGPRHHGYERGDRGDYGRSSGDQCRNWRRECARLHGMNTEGWQDCMEQPGALRDCGRR